MSVSYSAADNRMGIMKETPKTHYILGFLEIFLESTLHRDVLHFINFLKRKDMLCLLVILLCVEV